MSSPKDRDRGRRLQAAEEFVKKIPQPFPRTLTGPSAVKKFFNRQEDALQFASDFGDGMFVFAFETTVLGGGGARRFLAATAECFLHEYKQLDEKYKHYYEVIPKGRPCRLYLDLEFSREDNAGHDGQMLTRSFVEMLIQALDLVFSVKVSADEVIMLDSSTDVKFSKHLIFNSDLATFVNNIEMGAFVRAVHRAVEVRLDKDSARLCPACSEVTVTLTHGLSLPSHVAHQLWVRRPKAGPDEPLVTLCDLGVYTKNRNFRLIHSSKLGRNVALHVDAHWLGPALTGDQLFLRSLVTQVDPAASPLSLTCSCHRSWPGERAPTAPPPAPGIREAEECLSGHGLSPYAEVDVYIRDKVLDGRGWIRRWVYFPRRELLSFDVAGNRFCRNVGRQHRSNNVVYVVDLRRNVCYQKCLDPDCKQQNFRSEEWPIPRGVLPWESLMEEEEDEMLARVLRDVENTVERGEEERSPDAS